MVELLSAAERDAVIVPRVTGSMSDAFHLLDLRSQVLAVQWLLSGRSEDEKLAWLASHGELTRVKTRVPGGRDIYRLESGLGFVCMFFIDGDEFRFLGECTNYTIMR